MGSVVPLSSYRRPGSRKAASGRNGREADRGADVVILPVVRVARPEPAPRPAPPAAAEPGLLPN